MPTIQRNKIENHLGELRDAAGKLEAKLRHMDDAPVSEHPCWAEGIAAIDEQLARVQSARLALIVVRHELAAKFTVETEQ